MSRPIKISLFLSLAFIGLVRFQPLWERTPGGYWNVFFYLSIGVLFIWICIEILVELVRVVRKRKELTLLPFAPVAVLAIGMLDVMYNPLNIDLEKLHGEIQFRACREGTQNQATFYLRGKDKFEIHSTGAFFYDQFFTGTYERNADTLYLHYNTEELKFVGDTLLIKDEYLYAVESDTLRTTQFYLGYCKGLN